MAKKLTKSKASKILHDKEVHGHPLTEQQRKFFGAIAGGAEPYKAQVGNTITPITPQASSSFFDLIFSAPQKLSTMAFTGRYETPSEAMNIENPYGAFVVNAILDPINLFAGAGILKSARKALAFKPNPEAFYRGLGKSGLEDALESKLLRTANKTGTYGGDLYMTPNFSVAKTAYSVDKPTMIFNPKKVSSKNPWGMESVKPKDAKSYIVEIPKSKVPGAEQVGEGIFKTKGPISIDDVKFYTEDWLRGYKQVKPPKKQNGGWLDKYDAPQAQNGIEGTMGGLTDVGFNYNGAWGGTMQMGGVLPGAVGFTYARTAGAAPANGPYAKKTKASAQNGQEMKYYQEGLDFKPKTISQDGSTITTDINDYRRWQDSVRNYIRGQKDLAKARTNVKKNINTFSLMSGSGLVGAFSNLIQGDYQGKRRFLPKYTEQSLPRQYWGPSQYPQVPKDVIVVGDPGFDTSRKIKGLTEALEENKNLTETNVLPYSAAVEIYHPPVRKSLKYQPPVKKQQTSRTIGPFPLPESKKLAKPIPIPRDTRDLGYTLPTPGQFTAPELYKYNPDTPTKFSFTYPTGGYNEQKTIYFPTRSAWKSYVEGIKGTEKFKGSQEGVDYAQATGYLQDGGDIPVDPMGYWNPENVGNPVTIPSNIITMEGVDQPLLGISDTGDVQYMEPGEDYEFDGEYVTEYPVAKGGVSVNNADAQPLKKLDQLFNFTNYNKPTKGGWLDKYN